MRTKAGFLILLFAILSGCGSGQLKTTDIENDEAILVGKAFINNGGQLIEKEWNFLWDERLWGKNGVRVDSNGFVFMKIPEGKHFISLLQFNQYRKNIPDNHLSIDVEGGRIYYVGDITFNWDISDKDVASTGMAGAVLDSKIKEPAIDVDVKDNFEETVKIFNEKYSNTKKVEKQIIKIAD